MGVGPVRFAAGVRSAPRPARARDRCRTPSRPREGRVRRAGCRPGSRRGEQPPGAGADGVPGCGPRPRRPRGRPRSRPAGGCSRRRHPHRTDRPRGARPAGWARCHHCPRCDLDQRAAWPRSRSGAATGRRPGARRSGREPRATLGPATRQDGAPGAGAHPQAEPMGLRPPTVVRLERALAHSWAPVRLSGAEAMMPKSGWRTGATGPCRTSTTQRKKWTAWTRDSGRHDGSTGSRYVRSSHRVKPNGGLATDRTSAGEPATVTGSDTTSRRDTPPPAHIAAKKSDGLWTTACWGLLGWVASPSAGRLPYPPARNGAPASRIGSARLSTAARPGAHRVMSVGGPCVHRLWMTVWTSVITGQTGH
jgi:hypothetical protein